VLTNRGVAAVGAPIHSVNIVQFDHDDEAPFLSQVITERGRVPLAPFLAESDIVVNCTLQDPNNPLTYLRTEDLAAFSPGSLVVDVSCDEGMGFSWARSTTFSEPMFATVIGGPEAWDGNETISRAIEIRDGVVLNKDVLEFQRRQAGYPHLAV
jgi:NAD/NADP transhydrogenase alpha subunit